MNRSDLNRFIHNSAHSNQDIYYLTEAYRLTHEEGSATKAKTRKSVPVLGLVSLWLMAATLFSEPASTWL